MPDTAMAQVPMMLFEDTKRLREKTPTEIAEIVRSTVDQIDHGNIESINNLVMVIIQS